MDQTPRGYPYPQCEPPLVKDASFIGQMQTLAEAIDADMTDLEAQAQANLITPQAAYMLETPATAWTVNSVQPVYTTTVFETTPGMGDTLSSGIRILTSGWYLLGTYAVVIIGAGTEINARTLFLRNGQPITAAGDQARLATATAEDPYLSTVAQLSAGDLIRTRIQHSGPGATAYTTQARLWAFQLVGA